MKMQYDGVWRWYIYFVTQFQWGLTRKYLGHVLENV